MALFSLLKGTLIPHTQPITMTQLLTKHQSSSTPRAKNLARSLAKTNRSIKRWTSPAPPPERLPEAASEENNLSLAGFRYSYRFYTHPSFTASPVFFISGAFQNMKSWKNHADYFYARRVPVILADLPGTGDSDPLPAEYGLDFLAQAVRLVIDDLGIHKVFIVAASYGTPIAYSFAAQYPGLVSKLILAGTMKEVPAHMKQRVANTLIPLQEDRMDQFAKEVAEGLVVMLTPGSVGPLIGSTMGEDRCRSRFRNNASPFKTGAYSYLISWSRVPSSQ